MNALSSARFPVRRRHVRYVANATPSDSAAWITPWSMFHLELGGARLTVAGVDDLGRDWARGVLEHPALPPLAAAAAPGSPLIVLSHRPDCFARAARLGAALMLSG